MTRIGVILDSTRPGRRGEQVARWVLQQADRRRAAEFGAVGGVRAAEHLRLIAGELQMDDVGTNVALSLFTDFENFTVLTPGAHQAQALEVLLEEVIAWSEALASLRQIPLAA
jgi:NAD(P)H-dependent FMN reductase